MATQTLINRSDLESKIQTWISSESYLVETDTNSNVLKVRDYINPTTQFNVTDCNLKYHLSGVQQDLRYPFNNTQFKSIPLFGLTTSSVIPLSNLPARGDVYIGCFIQSKNTVLLTVPYSIIRNVYVGAIANSKGAFASKVNNDYTIRYLGEDKTSSFKNSRAAAYAACKGNWYSLFGIRYIHFNESGDYNTVFQISGYNSFELTGYATDFIYTKEPLTDEETYVLEALIANKVVGGDDTLLNRVLKPTHPYISGVSFLHKKVRIIDGQSSLGSFLESGQQTIITPDDKTSEGLAFSHWEVISGNVTLVNDKNSSQTITVQNQDITIRAIFKKIYSINLVDCEGEILG